MLTLEANSGETARPFAQDGIALFQDLCAMTAGEQGTFLKKATMPRSLGLELIESIVSGSHSTFLKVHRCKRLTRQHPELLKAVKERVCPLLIKGLSEKQDFAQSIRLMRAVDVVVKHFHHILVVPCEILLSIYGKLLDAEDVPIWQVILILECYHSIFTEEDLARFASNKLTPGPCSSPLTATSIPPTFTPRLSSAPLKSSLSNEACFCRTTRKA